MSLKQILMKLPRCSKLGIYLLIFLFKVTHLRCYWHPNLRVDEHLKWDAQLQHINNKRTKNVGILFKLRHYKIMPVNELKQLHYTLIFLYLNYGLMSWVTACQTILSEIKVSQNN